MEKLIVELAANLCIKLVVTAVVMDTIFGAGRAIKQHSFNSSVGIDGAIRKIAMLVSLICLAFVDKMIHINLIGFIPEEARSYLPQSINSIGLTEFFGILYLCYEIVSILKNMTLCGLPVKKLWDIVRKFLGKYTEELPDTEEQDEVEKKEQEQTGEIIATATNDVPNGALEESTDGTVAVYDETGEEVARISREDAEKIAAAVTCVKTE